MSQKRFSPTHVEIDLEALRRNFRRLRRFLPAKAGALCVVKSNAYGHGAPQVAKALEREGADFFGVGTVDEAVPLRVAGIRRPILVLLGLCRPDKFNDRFDDVFFHRLTPVISDVETAKTLDREARRRKERVPIHVKMDTGMTRLGVLPPDLGAFCETLKAFPGLIPQGLLTHLAEAGDKAFTRRQVRTFQEGIGTFRRMFPKGVRYYHVANSQGVIDKMDKWDRLPSAGGSRARWLGRMGIALYGAYPLEKDRKILDLDPVMKWKSRLIQVKNVPAGTAVSYNRTYKTRAPSRIGVLPVGYADGYPRLLSNRACVLVRGRRVPVAGVVCMDLMMVDLTAVPSAQAGDEVVLLGRQGPEEIRAEELAALAQTIPYEIFCRVSPRVTRVYV